MNSIKTNRIWPRWDPELLKFGKWLLVGCIACLTLPPIPAILLLSVMIYVGVIETEPIARELFTERQALKKKKREGTITRKESKKLDRLLAELKRTGKRRDTKIYGISWVVLVLTLFYLAHEISTLRPSQWLFGK